jgi:2,3-bisphosphoglycerate-dependent phosphoglycerate mutase
MVKKQFHAAQPDSRHVTTLIMQLYFIRHAQSTNNALWDATGSSKGRIIDPELTDAGRQQALFLAQFLCVANPSSNSNGRDLQNTAGFGITHLYTSLMVRAVATAAAIAHALRLPLQAWPELHEAGGIYREDHLTGQLIGLPGKDRTYFTNNYPELILPDWLDGSGWWNRPFEQPEERPLRARRILEELLKRHGRTQDRVAMVSHGEIYNHLLTALSNLPSRDGLWFALNNAAITRIDFEGNGVVFVYKNRADYLPVEIIT